MYIAITTQNIGSPTACEIEMESRDFSFLRLSLEVLRSFLSLRHLLEALSTATIWLSKTFIN